MTRRSWASAGLLSSLIVLLAPPAVVAQSPPAIPATSTRWMLLYAAGPTSYTVTYPHYTVDELVRFIAAVDTLGRPVQWLASGAMFLELYAPSGRLFTTWGEGAPANSDDWKAYIDSLVSVAGPVGRLDSAVALVAKALGPLGAPFKVVVMIPYPEPRVDLITLDGTAYHLKQTEDRVGLAHAYASDVVKRFPSRRLSNLAFDGFYWLREDIPREDTLVVIRLANEIHRLGYKFRWVPYFHPQAALWRRWGFDEAWLQPNYFFHPEVPASRVDTAVAWARAWGMGLEIEFNKKLLTSPQFEDRLSPYLARLGAAPDLRTRPVVIYEGAGALLDLAETKDPWYRALYAHLVDVLRVPNTAASH